MSFRTWRLSAPAEKSFRQMGRIPSNVVGELQRMADEAGCEARLMSSDGLRVLHTCFVTSFESPTHWPFKPEEIYLDHAGGEPPPTIPATLQVRGYCYYCGRVKCPGHGRTR